MCQLRMKTRIYAAPAVKGLMARKQTTNTTIICLCSAHYHKTTGESEPSGHFNN